MMQLELQQLLEFFLEGDDERERLDAFQYDPELPRQVDLGRAIIEVICGHRGPGAAVRQRLDHAIGLAGGGRAGQSRESIRTMLDKILHREGVRSIHGLTGSVHGLIGRGLRFNVKQFVGEVGVENLMRQVLPPTPHFKVIDAGFLDLTPGTPQSITFGPLQVSFRCEAPPEGPSELTVQLHEAKVSRLEHASALLWKDATDIRRTSFDAAGLARFRWATPGPRTLRLDAGGTAGVITLSSSTDLA